MHSPPKSLSPYASSPLQLAIAVFALVLGVYLLLSPAHFISTPDEELNLRTTLSLIEGRKGAIPPLPMGFASKTGIDGQEYAQYGLGLPIASAPWCLLGMIIDPTPNAAELNTLVNVTPATQAGTPFLRAWVTFFSLTITALSAAVFLLILVKLGLTQTTALFFTAFYAFGTYIWPHGRTLFTEPLVAFCWLAALYFIITAREDEHDNKWWFYAGLFWAYSLLTRFDTLVTLPAAAWFLFVREKDKRFTISINPKQIMMFTTPFIAVVSIILLYNQYRFDSLFSTGYEDQAENIKFATPVLVGLFGFLFTPGRSLFIYSPPLLFFPWGAFKLWSKNRWLTIGLGIHIVIFFLIMCKWQNWAGGYDWGPRHIYQLSPLLMILSAVQFIDKNLFDSLSKKIGWAVLAILALFVQLLALIANPTQTIKEFLSRWPSEQISPGLSVESIMLQFNVHLPQFSSLVLHWQKLWTAGPDLLFIRWPLPAPAMTGLLITSLLLIAFGLYFGNRQINKAR